MANRRTSTYIRIRNTGDRLIQDRWASLITIVGQVVAAGLVEGTVTTGPFTSQPTADEQHAVWLVTLLTDRVVNLQGRLARVAAAYPHTEITWGETTLRRILPTGEPERVEHQPAGATA
jgi:hypothetical protein